MILVTGGTGLVGAQVLLDLTKAGKDVRALKRSTSNMVIVNNIFSLNKDLVKRIEWIEGDVTDVFSVFEAMKEVKQVYHCAAWISFIPSEIKLMMKINVEGTANMVNAALENGVEKFCHISSVAAIGRTKEDKTITEKSTWKTSKLNSNYAISKFEAEQEVWRGIEEGLNAVIVNPSMILGPGDMTRGSTELFGSVWKGLRLYSEGVNGYVDVRDVSRCMLKLMESDISSERFIVSSECISYRELFSEIAEAFNKPRPTIKVNGWMSELGWRIEALRSFITRGKPFITKETAQSSQCQWFYSNEKIRTRLGIEFIPVRQSILDNCKVLAG